MYFCHPIKNQKNPFNIKLLAFNRMTRYINIIKIISLKIHITTQNKKCFPKNPRIIQAPILCPFLLLHLSHAGTKFLTELIFFILQIFIRNRAFPHFLTSYTGIKWSICILSFLLIFPQ